MPAMPGALVDHDERMRTPTLSHSLLASALDGRAVTPTPTNSPSSSLVDIEEFLLHTPSRHHRRTLSASEDAQTVQQSNLFDDEGGLGLRLQAPEDSTNESSAGLRLSPGTSDPSPGPSQAMQGRVRRVRSHERFGHPDRRMTKCRYREIDYSHSLRRDLYERDELMNDLKKQMQELSTAHDSQLRAIEDGSQQCQLASEVKIKDQGKKITELEEVILRLESEWQADTIEHKNKIAQLELDLRQHENDRQATALHRKNELDRLQMENVRLHTEIDKTNQSAALQLEAEVERLRNEMKTEMDSRLRDLLKENLARVIERSEQEQDEKLRLAQEAMRLEKEAEIAHLEQRYVQQGQPKTASTHDMDIHPPDVESTRSIAQADASNPRRPTVAPKPTSITPNLDAIRKLRKARGISRKSRLIGVTVEDESVSHPPGIQQRTSTLQPTDAPSASVDTSNPQGLTEAVTKGVEAALKNILANGHLTPNSKLCPRRRRAQVREVEEVRASESKDERCFILEQVRKLFKDKFGFTQDTEFMVYEPADQDEVHLYEYDDGPGPDLDWPKFDLRKNWKSPWNSAVLDILLQKLKDQCASDDWPIQRPDAYIRQALRDRYKRLRTMWQKGQPKITGSGMAETPSETEARLVAERELLLKQCRQTTRRRSKYARRATVVDHIVKLKTETGDDDFNVWKWLQKVVHVLGEHGMSSEDSDIENEVEPVLRVKRMDWRRALEHELEFLDMQRLVDVEVFAPQGSRPMKRIRSSGNPVTSRGAVKGLPRVFYSGLWIGTLTQYQLERLEISEESFSWMQVAVATV